MKNKDNLDFTWKNREQFDRFFYKRNSEQKSPQ